MLSSLGQIKSPIVRSITVASASFAIATTISALAIGLTNPKDKAANKAGIYVALIAAVAGAGLGLVAKGTSTASKSKQSKNKQLNNQDAWQDWRDLQVFRKQEESKEITSFYLKAVDGGSLPPFKPGQYLTIKLNIPEQKASCNSYLFPIRLC